MQSSGRAYLRPGHRVYVGAGLTTGLHAVHSIKIAIALEDSFRVRIGSRPWTRVRSIVIGSEVPHALEGSRAPFAAFWIHPEAFLPVGRGRRLAVGVAGTLGHALEESVRAPLRRYCEAGGDPGELDEVASRIVLGLRSEVAITRLDTRIARVIEALSGPDEPPRHDALATQVKLSATRLTHLFREETGVSLANYQLWNRGRLAMTRLVSSQSITALAHASGFADGAHLSRTSRRMLGVTPTQVLRRCRFFGDGGSVETRSGAPAT